MKVLATLSLPLGLGQIGNWALPALALATLVSEDLTCLTAGLLVARGDLAFWPATLACFLGIFVGDLLLVGLGRWAGRAGLEAPAVRRWIAPEAVRRAELWAARRGLGIILISRFLPGTRFATFVAAGVLRLPVLGIALVLGLAAAVWTPLLVAGSMVAGAAMTQWYDQWTASVPLLLLGGLGLWLLFRLGTGLATWRGRRLLLGRWRRMSRWEYWPTTVLYAPVFVEILRQGWRYRSLTLFTAANPGIPPDGGFVGESKGTILRGLAPAGDRVARWCLLPPGPPADRWATLEAWRTREQVTWPIVLKPDVGERGAGVVIARNEADVDAALARSEALLAQAYVPGVEFGIFYVRPADAAHGEIFAVTEKRLLAVVGNGERTLEQLILGHDRAVAQASLFLQLHASRLLDVPAAGEVRQLSELGTHCRGAWFLDGQHLVTPALQAAVEQVSRTLPGFHFGRYDVRTPSAEALQQGEFTVIELNGVTSEATSIYDPRYSVWHGWRVLREQWRLAFHIGAENRRRGHQPLTFVACWHRLGARRRTDL